MEKVKIGPMNPLFSGPGPLPQGGKGRGARIDNSIKVVEAPEPPAGKISRPASRSHPIS